MKTQQCIVCNGQQKYYFSKNFDVYDLVKADYWRCENCGFTSSKTHFDMDDATWALLNDAFHKDAFAREDNPYNRNQRYFNQALMLSLAKKHNILEGNDWLDWGCGVGSLSGQLSSHFGLHIDNFDMFVRPQLNAVAEEDLSIRSYSLVVNTAVFEHVRSRDTLNEIEQYVQDNGTLAVHTLVRGEIPADPDWMYLLPVHCAFHTNKSMDILMQQWGYTCSVYNEHAKLWLLFKLDPGLVENKTKKLNDILGWQYLHFKTGFMDFWP